MIDVMDFLAGAALGRNTWWRYLLGLALIVFATLIVGAVPLAVVVTAVMLDGDPATDVNRTNGAISGVPPALSLAVILFPFVLALVTILLVVRFIHRRPAGSLVAPGRPIRWRRVAQGLAVWGLVAAAATVLEAVIFPGRYRLTLDLGRLLPFAVVALLLFPLQSSAEELFFRGYLLQALGRLTRSRVLVALVTGLIFALLHIENPEVTAEFWLVMSFYFAFGVGLALIALRDNGLELPLGIHAGNNLFTALVANFKGSAVESPSIFTASGFTPWFSLATTLVGLGVLYVVFFARQR
jgi:hypothetical protein